MIFGRISRLRSIGDKVVWAIVLTSGLAVLVVAIVSGVQDYLSLRARLVETVASQAVIVALNSSAPLAFRDVESATEALSAFRAARGITSALLVDIDGAVFARYLREGAAQDTQETLLPEGHWARERDQVMVLGVSDRSGTHGRLQVHYVDSALRRQALLSAVGTLVLASLALVLAVLVARRVRGMFVAPVNELGRVARHVAETDDYSERATKFSEDELGQFTDYFNAMLGAVEANRDELLHAQRAAEQASRLKDEFVATLSHELRTPMSPITAWAHMLRRKPPTPEVLARGLDVIDRNARMLVQIVDDLLDMSRILAGSLRLDVQPVDLSEVIAAALDTVRPAADARQVRLQTALDPAAGAVRGDPARLQQVVWNLLSNAIKFSAKGSPVHVALERVESHVEIIVSDAGIGIAPEFLPHVFDRFRQADGSSTREYGGLGLGLAIVKQLVELHGGTVAAHSAGVGHGTRVVVALPLASLHGAVLPAAVEHPRSERPARAPQQMVSLAGVDVLVVEDNDDMRALVAEAIEQAGGTVRAAGSMSAALAQLDESVPDVMVSDIGMPGGDGYALMREVRGRGGACAALPAIALTAFARSEDRTRALLAGFSTHVAKPVEPLELAAAIASLAGRLPAP
jgi:signal transduction histidine kinase/CheY-like chemotaxis protein